MSALTRLSENCWNAPFDFSTQHRLTHDLESGQVLFFPELRFELSAAEQDWVENKVAGITAKNVSFNPKAHKIKGLECDAATEQLLAGVCSRFHQQAVQLVEQLFPHYHGKLQVGMTSLRPVEIEGRISASPKKDDTKLHVDAFPSRPNQGRRILRVFTNINMQNKPRVWRVGEPFELVAKRFFPTVKMPCPITTRLMKYFKITKSLRTRYDAAMLQIHDNMKADADYQKNLKFEEIAFPAGSTWIVFSDSVSHAVLSGKDMMEQTFYLPADAMQTPALSPLKILETLAQKALVS